MCLPYWQRILSHNSVGKRKGVPEAQLLPFLTWAPEAVGLHYTSANRKPFQMIFFPKTSWLFFLP